MKKLTLIYLSLFCSPLAQASALYFYEIGTEDTALAGAGQAARAQDASTIVILIVQSIIRKAMWR